MEEELVEALVCKEYREYQNLQELPPQERFHPHAATPACGIQDCSTTVVRCDRCAFSDAIFSDVEVWRVVLANERFRFPPRLHTAHTIALEISGGIPRSV